MHYSVKFYRFCLAKKVKICYTANSKRTKGAKLWQNYTLNTARWVRQKRQTR